MTKQQKLEAITKVINTLIPERLELKVDSIIKKEFSENNTSLCKVVWLHEDTVIAFGFDNGKKMTQAEMIEYADNALECYVQRFGEDILDKIKSDLTK